MGARAAVIGASGYAGGELLRILAAHPQIELGAITADSSAGRTVGELHPHLAGVAALADRSFAPAGRQLAGGCDIAFLALPAGQSAEAVSRLPDAARIVDLGPDFRLADAAAWQRHYPGPHPGRWTTGLPELPGARAQVRAARRVAVPGCYATAAILALTPLVAAGLAAPGDVVVVAASGTSGAGRSLRPGLLATEVMGAVSAYQAAGAHRHTPEIEQALDDAGRSHGGAPGGNNRPRGARGAGGAPPASAAGTRPARVSFTPVLAPMPRGILATCTARLTSDRTATEALRAAIAEAYAGEPFISLLPEGRWPTTAAVAGSNGVHLQAAADSRAGRAVVVAAIDNLGKGAAGGAVQNANLMLGLAETAGLTNCGVAP
jgi:N-acetyl-gamma-glutamyl-phosphate reductase